jgi:hypothetical protein
MMRSRVGEEEGEAAEEEEEKLLREVVVGTLLLPKSIRSVDLEGI